MGQKSLGRGIFAFMTVVVAALVSAAILFAVLTLEMLETNATSRHDLIQMSEAFALEFEHEREPDAIAPGTFRRQAIERLTHNPALTDEETSAKLRLPGMPGQEVGVKEGNPRLRALMRSLANTDPVTYSETRFEDSRLISRSVYPILATEQSCVTCHNDLIDGPPVALGDMMGAYIVESDLTSPTLANLSYSGLAFMGFLISFSLLGRREFRRMQNTVNALERQVVLEREKCEAEEYAKFIACHDVLTGLPNRGLFMDRLHSLLCKAPDQVLLALIDLDDFKGINDSYGHDVGDTLLCEQAQRLKRAVAPWEGMVARLGGDEFGIIINTYGKQLQPQALGETLQHCLQEPVYHGKLEVHPFGTVGIVLGAENHSDPATILKRADMALYVAKERGKSRYAVFDHTIAKALERRMMIEQALPQAIVEGRIIPAFQPKICMRTGQILGFEALARWQHNGENISPAEFSKVAEDISLIREVDLCILRKATEIASRVEKQTGVKINLASNVSPKNFGCPSIAEDIADTLFSVGFPASRLTVEVTETFPLHNWEAISKSLDTLREYGIRTALDDFGTGYSSLSCLQRLRVDEVKIDRDFVIEIEHDRETAILFESIVAMVRGLNRRVVVEGIETDAQARLVMRSGAYIGQGYLFAKPVAAEDLAEFLMSFDPKRFQTINHDKIQDG